MDIQAEKLSLLQTIMNLNDEGSILDLKALLATRKTDWFDELNDAQQKSVLRGLEQADQNDTVPHSEAVKLFGKWGLK